MFFHLFSCGKTHCQRQSAGGLGHLRTQTRGGFAPPPPSARGFLLISLAFRRGGFGGVFYHSRRNRLKDNGEGVRGINEKDFAEGGGRVQMPDALDRKYPNAPADWRWQWVFPQENRWKNTKTTEECRHHMDESIMQRTVKEAVISPGITASLTVRCIMDSSM